MFDKQGSIVLPKGTCDVIKLIAALLVVTSHIGSVALGPAYNSTHWSFYLLATQNGYMGVALFFFLSGYGLMESEIRSHLPLYQFIKRRFLKVYFPVLLVTGLWLLITPPHLSSSKSGVCDLLWGFADPVMWFIRVLIPLYAVFYIGSISAKYIGWGKISGIILIACIAYSVYRQICFDTIRDHSVPLFALGIMSALYKRGHLSLVSISILVIGLFVSGFGLLTSHPITNTLHSMFDYTIVVGVILTVSIFKLDWHLSSWLSAILFDVYLVHFKYFTLASEVWQIPLWLFLILSVPVSFALAYVFMRLRTSIAKALHI